MRIRSQRYLQALWVFVVFLVWLLPQWLGAVWGLYSSEPLAKALSRKLHVGRIAIPHFSLYWVTTPPAVLLMGILIYREVKRRAPPKQLLNIEQLDDNEFRRQAAKWLTKRLTEKKLGVQRAILFGSVVHEHYPTSDVDVIIFGKPMSDRRLKASGRKLKADVRKEFEVRFNHQLHLLLYAAREKERMEAFIEGLSKLKELQLGGDH